jgi:hypothetical protein
VAVPAADPLGELRERPDGAPAVRHQARGRVAGATTAVDRTVGNGGLLGYSYIPANINRGTPVASVQSSGPDDF